MYSIRMKILQAILIIIVILCVRGLLFFTWRLYDVPNTYIICLYLTICEESKVIIIILLS